MYPTPTPTESELSESGLSSGCSSSTSSLQQPQSPQNDDYLLKQPPVSQPSQSTISTDNNIRSTLPTNPSTIIPTAFPTSTLPSPQQLPSLDDLTRNSLCCFRTESQHSKKTNFGDTMLDVDMFIHENIVSLRCLFLYQDYQDDFLQEVSGSLSIFFFEKEKLRITRDSFLSSFSPLFILINGES
jgi:hypothetical protein